MESLEESQDKSGETSLDAVSINTKHTNGVTLVGAIGE